VAAPEKTILRLYSHKANKIKIISLISVRYMKAFDFASSVVDWPLIDSSRFCSRLRIVLEMWKSYARVSWRQMFVFLNFWMPLASFKSSFVPSSKWLNLSA